MIGVARYHVPRSQVWRGSRGRASGNVHLHAPAELESGRLRRRAGEALCSKRSGWYEREPDDRELELERCPECVKRAARVGLDWPEPGAGARVEPA